MGTLEEEENRRRSEVMAKSVRPLGRVRNVPDEPDTDIDGEQAEEI